MTSTPSREDTAIRAPQEYSRVSAIRNEQVATPITIDVAKERDLAWSARQRPLGDTAIQVHFPVGVGRVIRFKDLGAAMTQQVCHHAV